MNEEIVTGIVLYATDLKEYDKRMVVLTKEHGKITMFANGARRANSPLRAAGRSFTMGRFTVFPGRDSYTLKKAEITTCFEAIEQDVEKLCYASYFCELMSYYTREGDFCVNHLNLLYLALTTLEKGELSYGLVRNVYELKLMDLEGETLHAFTCVKCGSNEKLSFFSAEAGGFLCEGCGGETKGTVKVSDTLVYAVRYILSKPLPELFSFALAPEAERELSRITERFVHKYVDKEFKSLEILSGLI